MAAPVYTTDLTTYNDCTSVTGWLELIGMALSAPPDIDTDLAIHGSVCITSDRAKTGLSSNAFVGAGFTLATGECIFVWHKFFAPNSLGLLSEGGVRVMVGDSSSVWDGFYVDGSDTYPYGGWRNHVVDPTLTPDSSAGTTTGTYAMVGNGWNLPTQAPAKGNPFNTDIIRYGRGESRFTDGDITNGYATFLGYSLVNDHPTTGRFGLIQAVGAGYLYKGLMSLGLTATSVDMRDANVNISIDNTAKVASTFNSIEVHNASSVVYWNTVNFTALGTVAKGSFEMIDNADVILTGCTFTGMGTFIFLSNGDAIDCTFRGCDQITHGGGIFTGTIMEGYEGTSDTAYLLYATAADPDGELDGMSFTKGTASTHAIEFDATNTPTTITLRNIDFSGYNATNGSTDSALYFPSTTKSYTVNLVGCTGDISYKVGSGGSVSLVIDPVTLTITAKDSAGVLMENVRVMALVASAANSMPYNTSVSIARVTTTATVTHTAHGLSTGDYIRIANCITVSHLNGVRQITVTTVDAYTYTCEDSGGASDTGGDATLAIAYGLSSALGVVTGLRSYGTADQPIAGWGRKSTSAPFYSEGRIGGTIDKTSGLSIEMIMGSD